MLLEHGIDVNAVNEHGCSALYDAHSNMPTGMVPPSKHQAEIIRLLEQHGGRLTRQDRMELLNEQKARAKSQGGGSG